MKLFNSLTRQVEDFEPREKGKVGMYTCGPTVYSLPTIGNWRTNVLSDLLKKSFEYLGYEVKSVMNLTDVGHLVSDGDEGEDKLEKAAKKEGKDAWKMADFYIKDFKKGMKELNIEEADVLPRATEHIKEQIELIKKIEKVGLTYQTSDGIYFNVVEYEKKGSKYGQMSTLDQIREGARVEVNKEKKDPRDFALWKFSREGEKRQMEWESPWGVGFPGWHIECSAMSMKYLGEQFDVHVGGEDLKSTHHPNEVAQAEAGTGKKPFVRYWIHGGFLLVDGGKMGKSLNNAYTLEDIEKKGFEALDLRYFYLTGHYQKQLNFTWEALGAAKEARLKLKRLVESWQKEKVEVKEEKTGEWQEKFKQALENDLQMPQVLAVVWEMVKDGKLSETEKLFLITKFDQVLGLGLGKRKTEEIPTEILELIEKRDKMREDKKWDEADKMRDELMKRGWRVLDGEKGVKVERV